MTTPTTRVRLAREISRKHGRIAAEASCLLLVAGLLQACGGSGATGTIQSVELVPGQTLATGNTIAVIVSGVGECNVTLDWGDGTIDSRYVVLTSRAQQTHSYSGWGGGKTVTATGTGCLGRALTRFRITPLVYSIGDRLSGTQHNGVQCRARYGSFGGAG